MDQKPLVLLVDDQEDVRSTLSTILEFYDFRVEEASDGYQAIEKAGQLSPAIVLLDIGMPGIDGFETARRLRTTSSVPVIAVTAFGLPEYEEKAKEAGFDSFLVKPVLPEVLVAEIRRLIAPKSAS